ncbi:hypothetical protein NE237_024257 [Protea cynaroides]|uniref:FAD-binding domain-containing protein n=1 Tax=Protea cynaroides TaxID=273540 RepID=A0A9Q0HDL0_9MAGN|nr:hypothetical protein NE237_024257 [Protea cynaroides]
METVEDIVIVGAGIAGLTTCLGLHRLGLRSLVLESWDCLRVTGFAFSVWTNAWKALDALGIGDSLRQQHYRLQRSVAISSVSGLPVSQVSYDAQGKHGDHEVRCVLRKVLLESLSKELPPGTIRFSSKVFSIEQEGYLKVLHLENGSIVKTKVLIGCDGVNSVVAQWLGLQRPITTKRWSTRGYLELLDGHGFEPKFLLCFGDGFRSGFFPCNKNAMYWFFTWISSDPYKEIEDNATKLKQFVLSKLGKVPKDVKDLIEKTDLDSIISSPLRFRWPFNVLWGDIYKDNVCVAGDALHPMTPDIGQGGCSALEDGIVLARCLAEALSTNPKVGINMKLEEEEYKKIKMALKKFSNERKWRSFDLISTAYVMGFIQQSNQKIITFLRDKLLSPFMAKLLLKKADFDCGKLKLT